MKILSILFFLFTAIASVQSYAGDAGIHPFPRSGDVLSADPTDKQVAIKASKQDAKVQKEISEILTNKTCKLGEVSAEFVSGVGMMGGSKSAYIVIQKIDCEPMITTSVVTLVKLNQILGTQVKQPVQFVVSIIRLE